MYGVSQVNTEAHELDIVQMDDFFLANSKKKLRHFVRHQASV